jgi:hypothetical protein
MPRPSVITLLLVGILLLLLAGAPMWVFWIAYGGFLLLIIYRHLSWRLLPVAILEVDGHTIEYRYKRKCEGEFTLFMGEDRTRISTYFILSKSPIDQSLPIIGLNVVQMETSPFKATFTLEGESYPLHMLGGFGRCPCGRKTPCWTGQIYVATFTYDRDDYHLGGQIVFVDQVEKPKRKQRKPIKLKLPSWKIFPHPTPSPS